MVNPYTQYQNYNSGENWEYNTEMERLFTDRVPADTLANRPTATDAPDNALYLATDEGLLYRNDPTNGWGVEPFGTSTSRVPGTSYFTDVNLQGVGGPVTSTKITNFEGNLLGVDASGVLNFDDVSLAQERISGSETDTVSANGDYTVALSSLADTETVEIYRAALTQQTIAAIPTGVSLELVTFDNAGGFTSQATLISGDGATIHDDVTGSPLASYQNISGASQSIGVVVNDTTGASQDFVAYAEGLTGL